MEHEQRKFIEFQMSCNKCFEIIYQGTFWVIVDTKGEPLRSEAERVFKYPEFKDIKKCRCCLCEGFSWNYSFEDLSPIPESDNLPF